MNKSVNLKDKAGNVLLPATHASLVSGLSVVATSGSYNDLLDKPAGQGVDLSNYYTKTEVDAKITGSGTFDPSQYYNKTQVDEITSSKQDKLTINGSNSGVTTLYAPTTYGASGKVLVAKGENASPEWETIETSSGVTVDNKNASLTYGNTTTIATIDGTDIKVTMPSAPEQSEGGTVIANNPTLDYGTTSTIATVGSTELKVTMPAKPATGSASDLSTGTNTTGKLWSAKVISDYVADNAGSVSVSVPSTTPTITTSDTTIATINNVAVKAKISTSSVTVSPGNSSGNVTAGSVNSTDLKFKLDQVVGSSSNSTSNGTNSSNAYLNTVANNSVISSHKISGTNGVTVSSNASGEITISGPGSINYPVTSVAGNTGAVTAAQISSALTNSGAKLTDTTYAAGDGLLLNGTTFALKNTNESVGGTIKLWIGSSLPSNQDPSTIYFII